MFSIRHNSISLKKKSLRIKLNINPILSKLKRKVSLGAVFLIILGFFLVVCIPVYRQAQSAFTLAQKSSNFNPARTLSQPIKPDARLNKEDYKEDEIPERLLIPSLSLDLKIVPSKIKNGYWELSETNASFGLGSGPIGKSGNSVIFAHAREGLFANLKEINKGNRIYIFSENKYFTYEVVETKEVSPNDLEVISPTKKPVLTLYTCSGFADTKRLIIKAKLLNSSDSI